MTFIVGAILYGCPVFFLVPKLRLGMPSPTLRVEQKLTETAAFFLGDLLKVPKIIFLYKSIAYKS